MIGKPLPTKTQLLSARRHSDFRQGNCKLSYRSCKSSAVHRCVRAALCTRAGFEDDLRQFLRAAKALPRNSPESLSFSANNGVKETFKDRLTLFTETPHPAVWAGASIWALADPSILTWEPTNSWNENKVIHNSREGWKADTREQDLSFTIHKQCRL